MIEQSPMLYDISCVSSGCPEQAIIYKKSHTNMLMCVQDEFAG